MLVACGDNPKPTEDAKPTRWLEDIAFDKKWDDADFKICGGEENIVQYFNLGDNLAIKGGKPKILNAFKEAYSSTHIPKESGLVRIRFIVNCNGETDRFRMLESDLDYKEKTFHKDISTQLMDITKSLTGWEQKMDDKNIARDYYQYLIFRIVDGKIVKILP